MSTTENETFPSEAEGNPNDLIASLSSRVKEAEQKLEALSYAGVTIERYADGWAIKNERWNAAEARVRQLDLDLKRACDFAETADGLYKFYLKRLNASEAESATRLASLRSEIETLQREKAELQGQFDEMTAASGEVMGDASKQEGERK